MNSAFAIAVAVLLVPVAQLRADAVSHRAAAETLLESLDMQNTLNNVVDQMLLQQQKQNPGIKQFEPQMREFFAKYMSWESMKEDVIQSYMEVFTEGELKELTAFYMTPVGKKAIQKLPELMAKGAVRGQQRVEEHLPELQAAIEKAAAEKK
jgi:hypothetical protein